MNGYIKVHKRRTDPGSNSLKGLNSRSIAISRDGSRSGSIHLRSGSILKSPQCRANWCRRRFPTSHLLAARAIKLATQHNWLIEQQSLRSTESQSHYTCTSRPAPLRAHLHCWLNWWCGDRIAGAHVENQSMPPLEFAPAAILWSDVSIHPCVCITSARKHHVEWTQNQITRRF